MFFVSQGSCRVGPVKALGRALTVDLRRALVSGRFLLTVGLLLLWQLFNCSGTLLSANEWTKSSAVYAFNFAISNQEVLADLLLPLAALPYAGASSRTGRVGLSFRRWSGWGLGPTA